MSKNRFIPKRWSLLLLGAIGLSHPSLMANEFSHPNSTVASELQQPRGKIRGKVIDSKTGEIIIGASVIVKGKKSQGAITDIDGNFAIDVPIGTELEISYMGYSPVIIRATDKAQVIRLVENSVGLSDLIVVGYTTQKRESLTGSMLSIKSDKLKDITTPSVSNLLNGKAPGVYVAPGSGQPGASGAVVIRGQATLSGTTAPLWVIDGVIVGSNAGQLNPQDIESLTVLKDAASTAIYGSQGANGVIVVTTKSARAGKMRVSVDAKTGISKLNTGNLRMMNGAELYDYYASFANANTINFTRWNDNLRNSNFSWWDLATTTGITQEYNLSMQGGTDQLSGIFSLGYYDETGAVRGYDFDRYNFRTRLTFKPLTWLTIRPSLSGSLRKVHDQQYSVGAMYSMLPWDSPYDEKGNLVPNRYSGWVNSQQNNYLNDLQWNYSKGKYYEFMGNLDFDVKLTPWLTFSSVNNMSYRHNTSEGYQDPRSVSGEGVSGRITNYGNEYTSRYSNQKLLISQLWGSHSLNALLAYEYNDYIYSTLNAQGVGFVPGFSVLDVTAKPEQAKGNKAEWAKQSFFANTKYAYDNKYFAEAMIRRDGASNFGTNAKYGMFFAISGAWTISKEKWFQAKWVDNLKLRASYGTVGNPPSELYPQYDLYSVSAKYNERSGALISQIGNKDLTWERTISSGVGLDASFLNGRMRLTLDLYSKDTQNILYNVPITGLVGVTNVWRNIGKMRNRGIEISIGGDIIRTKNINWSIDFNLGANRNELRDLYAQKDAHGNMVVKPVIISDGTSIAGSANMILEVGEPIDTLLHPRVGRSQPRQRSSSMV